MLSISTGSDPGYLTKQVGAGAEHYYLRSIGEAGEPPGVWLGAGAPELGLSGEVDAGVMTDLYTDFIDPRKRDEMHARLDAIEAPRGSEEYREQAAAIRADARLGSAPKSYEKAFEKRFAAKLEKEAAKGGEVTPERRRALEMEARKEAPSATLYYDLTFSAPKSWSVYHASLQVKSVQAREAAEAAREAGDEDRAAVLEGQAEHYADQAGQVWDAWMEGVQAGIEHMQEEAGYSRVGHHGQAVAGRTSGRYVEASEFTAAAFRQHTSRNDDPQLHVHVAVLNKVKTVDIDPATGDERVVWRAVDGSGLFKHKRAAGHIAERVAGEALERTTGVRVAMRPDGKAREIVGISQDKRDAFSTRRADITAGVAELARAYEERHGYAPSPYALARMSEHVTLEKRRAKSHDAVPRDQLLDRWEASAQQRLRSSLADVPADVALESALQPGIDSRAMYWEPRETAERAIAAVQEKSATWTRQDLIVELDKHLPDSLGGLDRHQVRALLDQLADDALAPAAGLGVVSTAAPDVVEVPQELQRADGSFVFAPNPKTTTRYTVDEHLRTEERIAAYAAGTGAPTIDTDAVEQVIARRRLEGAQAEFVRSAATSGHQVDILVGPAGTGKSYVMSALTEAWTGEPADGGDRPRVLGLASGQRAADVLAEEGLKRTTNIAKFLTEQENLAKGGRVDDLYTVKPGDLVVVDEAGMTATEDLERVRRIVEASGAKMVLSGDWGQLTAVGAGGMFGQLATELDHVHTLDEVRRFTNADGSVRQWEADASLAMREGDAAALDAYETHGRFRGGSAEDMTERAYQGWMADHLDGKKPLLIAPTNAAAAELSARARADLVRAGQVEADGVRLRVDAQDEAETYAGRGDMVQMRLNDRDIADGDAFAVNRLVGRVVDRTRDGGLSVRLDDGAVLQLPPAYVANHVELAYASTVHGAQGRTVDVCHALIDAGTSRESLYVAMSRGRGSNLGYVITHDPAQAPVPADEVPDHLAVLQKALSRAEVERTATQVIRDEQDRREHLAVLEPVWSALKDEAAEAKYGAALREALGEEGYRRVVSEEEYGSLMRLVRHAEEQGRDGAELLVSAVQSRELATADSYAAVLHHRIEMQLGDLQKADAAADTAAQAGAVAAQEQQILDTLNPPTPPLAAAEPSTDSPAPETTPEAVSGPSEGLDEAVEPAPVEQVSDAVLPEGRQPDAAMLHAMQQSLQMQQHLAVVHGVQDSEVRQRQDDAREARAEELDSYTARTPNLPGRVGGFLFGWARQMDERTEALGRAVADEQPAWAVDRLGPVPGDPIHRATWERRAGRAARYREAHGYGAEHDAIGSAPPRGAVEARGAWERARRALGIGRDRAEVARASDAALREVVDRYDREQAWAPPYVAEELQQASLARDDYRAQAHQTRLRARETAEQEAAEHAERSARHDEHVFDVAGLAQTGAGDPREQADADAQVARDAVLPDGQAVDPQMLQLAHQAAGMQELPVAHRLPGVQLSERQRAIEEQADALAHLAQATGERADALDEVHQARAAWHDHTRDLREDAVEARAELDRRTGPAPAGEDVEADHADPTAGGDEAAPLDVDRALQQAREAQQVLAERAAERETGPVEAPEVAAEEADRERRDQGILAAAGRMLGIGRDREVAPTAEAPPPPPAPEPAPEPDIDM